jgi:hypothetical protein
VTSSRGVRQIWVCLTQHLPPSALDVLCSASSPRRFTPPRDEPAIVSCRHHPWDSRRHRTCATPGLERDVKQSHGPHAPCHSGACVDVARAIHRLQRPGLCNREADRRHHTLSKTTWNHQGAPHNAHQGALLRRCTRHALEHIDAGSQSRCLLWTPRTPGPRHPGAHIHRRDCECDKFVTRCLPDKL